MATLEAMLRSGAVYRSISSHPGLPASPHFLISGVLGNVITALAPQHEIIRGSIQMHGKEKPWCIAEYAPRNLGAT